MIIPGKHNNNYLIDDPLSPIANVCINKKEGDGYVKTFYMPLDDIITIYKAVGLMQDIEKKKRELSKSLTKRGMGGLQ